ncbi:XRE family transcriptional regulator, partial [Streptomyces sp. NPDC004726]
MLHAPMASFDASAARRMREGPWDDARPCLVRVPRPVRGRGSSETVLFSGRGVGAPGSREPTALAGVLWCVPRDPLDAGTTLREHPSARGLKPEAAEPPGSG